MATKTSAKKKAQQHERAMLGARIGLGLFETILKAVALVVVVILIAKYARQAYEFGYQIYNQTPVSVAGGRAISLTIESDNTVKEIAQLLEDRGLIEDATLFQFQERFSEHHGEIQPGTYTLSSAMTPEEMITIMSATEETEEGQAASSSVPAGSSAVTDEEAIEGAMPGAEGDLSETEGFDDFVPQTDGIQESAIEGEEAGGITSESPAAQN